MIMEIIYQQKLDKTPDSASSVLTQQDKSNCQK